MRMRCISQANCIKGAGQYRLAIAVISRCQKSISGAWETANATDGAHVIHKSSDTGKYRERSNLFSYRA